jgi:hypothetical protein
MKPRSVKHCERMLLLNSTILTVAQKHAVPTDAARFFASCERYAPDAVPWNRGVFAGRSETARRMAVRAIVNRTTGPCVYVRGRVAAHDASARRRRHGLARGVLAAGDTERFFDRVVTSLEMWKGPRRCRTWHRLGLARSDRSRL